MIASASCGTPGARHGRPPAPALPPGHSSPCSSARARRPSPPSPSLCRVQLATGEPDAVPAASHPAARNVTAPRRAAPGWRRRAASRPRRCALVDQELGEVDVGLGGAEGVAGLERHLPGRPVPPRGLGPPPRVVGEGPEVEPGPSTRGSAGPARRRSERLEVSRPEAGDAQLEVDGVEEHEGPHQRLVVTDLARTPARPARPSRLASRGRSCSTRTSAVRLSSRTLVARPTGVIDVIEEPPCPGDDAKRAGERPGAQVPGRLAGQQVGCRTGSFAQPSPARR